MLVQWLKELWPIEICYCVSSHRLHWTHPGCKWNSTQATSLCPVANSKPIKKGSFHSVELILWCCIVENHWALCSGCLFTLAVLMDAMQVFLWNPPTRCTCSQPGRQERGWRSYNVALFIRQELWHHQSRKVGPQGSPALRKMKKEDEADEICMNTAASTALTIFCLVKPGQKCCGEIMDGFDCCKVTHINILVTI